MTFLWVGLLTGLTFISFAGKKSEPSYQGLLWKISGNDLDTVSYLYGTMHTTDERAFRFTDEVLPAFERCQAFAMELNMSDVNPGKLVNRLTMDSSHTLKGLLGEDYDQVARFFKDSLGQNIALYKKLQPLFLTSLVSQRDLGADSAVPLDLYFYDLAQEQEKKIIGLERVEEQVDAFRSIPYEEQADMLVKTIKEAGQEDTAMQQLLNAYMKGDLDALLSLTKKNKATEGHTRIFLTERNQRMVERLEEHLRGQSVFVAVGAAHLPGKKGMIGLLRKKGFTVEPML